MQPSDTTTQSFWNPVSSTTPPSECHSLLSSSPTEGLHKPAVEMAAHLPNPFYPQNLEDKMFLHRPMMFPNLDAGGHFGGYQFGTSASTAMARFLMAASAMSHLTSGGRPFPIKTPDQLMAGFPCSEVMSWSSMVPTTDFATGPPPSCFKISDQFIVNEASAKEQSESEGTDSSSEYLFSFLLQFAQSNLISALCKY